MADVLSTSAGREVLTLTQRLAKSISEKPMDLESTRDILKLLNSIELTRPVLQHTQIGHKLRQVSLLKLSNDDCDIVSSAKSLIHKWNSMFGKKDAPSDAVVTASMSSSSKSPAKPSAPASAASSAAAVASSAASVAEPESTLLGQTGNDARNKIQLVLLKALRTNITECGSSIAHDELVLQIEDELFKCYGSVCDAYKEKFREIAHTLRDAGNDLGARLVSGLLPPAQLARMSSSQMISKEQAAQLKELIEWNRSAARSDITLESQGVPTDEFRCSRCHGNHTKYFQKQTRSSDEPMTLFITCQRCGNKWRKY